MALHGDYIHPKCGKTLSFLSFLVPPESVPGRMTILVTVFLVLVNIFNSITSNIPKVFRSLRINFE